MQDQIPDSWREVAREEAQKVYDDLSVIDSDGEQHTFGSIKNRINAIAPELTRRETLKVAVLSFGYISAGASVTTGILHAFSNSAEAAGTGEFGTQSNPLADVYSDSVTTEVLNSADIANASSGEVIKKAASGTNLEFGSSGGGGSERYISAGTSISDINSELTTSGTVVFEEGNHFVDDRIEIGTSDLTIIIQEGAHIKIDDSASPTQLTDDQARTDTPLFYNDGHNNVDFWNFGTLDGNETTFNRPICIWAKAAHYCSYYSAPEGIVDTHFGIFAIDSDGIDVPFAHSTDYTNAVVSFQGVHSSTIGRVYGEGGFIATDLNGRNQDITIDQVHGNGTTREALDIATSPDVTVNIVKDDSASDNIVRITSGSYANSYSDRTDPDNVENLTIRAIEGDSADDCIFLQGDGSAANMSLTGLNIRSTGGKGINMDGSIANHFDNLRLEGYVESTATGEEGVFLDGNGSEGLMLNLIVYSDDQDGIRFWGFTGVQGHITAIGCGRRGIQMWEVSGSMDDIDLGVVTNDNGQEGVILGGSVSDCKLSGISTGNTETDIEINSSSVEDTLLDVIYGAIDNSGTNTQEADYSAVT